jgi:hypothetical protein
LEPRQNALEQSPPGAERNRVITVLKSDPQRLIKMVASTSVVNWYQTVGEPVYILQSETSGRLAGAPSVVPVMMTPSALKVIGIALVRGQSNGGVGAMGAVPDGEGAGEVVGGPGLVGAGVVGGIARISSSNSPSQLIAPGSPYPETTI